MTPFTVAQMISDGRAEATRLHQLAERADALRVVGPPGSATAHEQAVIDYVKALRAAYTSLTLALNECEKNPNPTPGRSVNG